MGGRSGFEKYFSSNPGEGDSAAITAEADLTIVRSAQPSSSRYTQRYYGSAPWPDDGRNFSFATHADDLARLIEKLNAGPAHLVGWSYGGGVATLAALKPSVAGAQPHPL